MIKNTIFGMLIGALAGAVAMLLFAPNSGKKTRDLIQRKSIKVRDRTNEMFDDAVAQARSESHEIVEAVRDKAGQLKQQGQEKLVGRMKRASSALDSGIAAVKDA